MSFNTNYQVNPNLLNNLGNQPNQQQIITGLCNALGLTWSRVASEFPNSFRSIVSTIPDFIKKELAKYAGVQASSPFFPSSPFSQFFHSLEDLLESLDFSLFSELEDKFEANEITEQQFDQYTAQHKRFFYEEILEPLVSMLNDTVLPYKLSAADTMPNTPFGSEAVVLLRCFQFGALHLLESLFAIVISEEQQKLIMEKGKIQFWETTLLLQYLSEAKKPNHGQLLFLAGDICRRFVNAMRKDPKITKNNTIQNFTSICKILNSKYFDDSFECIKIDDETAPNYFKQEMQQNFRIIATYLLSILNFLVDHQRETIKADGALMNTLFEIFIKFMSLDLERHTKDAQYQKKLLKDWEEHLEIARPVKDRLIPQLFAPETRIDLIFTDPALKSNGLSPLKQNPAGENNFADNLADFSVMYLCSDVSLKLLTANFKEHKIFYPTILKRATALLKDSSNWKNQLLGMLIILNVLPSDISKKEVKSALKSMKIDAQTAIKSINPFVRKLGIELLMIIQETYPKDLPQTISTLKSALESESSTRVQLLCLESIHDCIDMVPKASDGEKQFESNILSVQELYYSILISPKKPFPTRIEAAIGLTTMIEVFRTVKILGNFTHTFKKLLEFAKAYFAYGAANPTFLGMEHAFRASVLEVIGVYATACQEEDVDVENSRSTLISVLQSLEKAPIEVDTQAHASHYLHSLVCNSLYFLLQIEGFKYEEKKHLDFLEKSRSGKELSDMTNLASVFAKILPSVFPIYHSFLETENAEDFLFVQQLDRVSRVSFDFSALIDVLGDGAKIDNWLPRPLVESMMIKCFETYNNANQALLDHLSEKSSKTDAENMKIVKKEIDSLEELCDSIESMLCSLMKTNKFHFIDIFLNSTLPQISEFREYIISTIAKIRDQVQSQFSNPKLEHFNYGAITDFELAWCICLTLDLVEYGINSNTKSMVEKFFFENQIVSNLLLVPENAHYHKDARTMQNISYAMGVFILGLPNVLDCTSSKDLVIMNTNIINRIMDVTKKLIESNKSIAEDLKKARVQKEAAEENENKDKKHEHGHHHHHEEHEDCDCEEHDHHHHEEDCDCEEHDHHHHEEHEDCDCDSCGCGCDSCCGSEREDEEIRQESTALAVISNCISTILKIIYKFGTALNENHPNFGQYKQMISEIPQISGKQMKELLEFVLKNLEFMGDDETEIQCVCGLILTIALRDSSCLENSEDVLNLMKSLAVLLPEEEEKGSEKKEEENEDEDEEEEEKEEEEVEIIIKKEDFAEHFQKLGTLLKNKIGVSEFDKICKEVLSEPQRNWFL